MCPWVRQIEFHNLNSRTLKALTHSLKQRTSDPLTGTNPLTSILLGAIVKKYAFSEDDSEGGDSSSTLAPSSSALLASNESQKYTDIQVITAVCLLSGIWQLGFAILGFGKLSWLLSEVLVSGYTTAAAIHVLVSQLKGVLGVHPDPVDESSFFRFKIFTVGRI